jgi:plastocyanin
MKLRLIRSGILAFALANLAVVVRAEDCATPKPGSAVNLWEFVGSATVNPDSTTFDVSVSNFQFTPANITIDLGDTVRWTVVNGLHTVISDTNAWAPSGTLGPGNTFSVTFNTLGLFPYYCQFHGGPGGSGMSGTVNVVPEPQTPALLLLAFAASLLATRPWRRIS